uniref:A to I editase domain-containing protein n=1 Tax=Parascaris univalens TaxID=6257 RepID=A0A915C8L2_PARUN
MPVSHGGSNERRNTAAKMQKVATTLEMVNQESEVMDATEDRYWSSGSVENHENISKSALAYISESGKNPVSLVMEYMQRVGVQVVFDKCIDKGGFQVSTVVDGVRWSGVVCSSKREAKVSCCRVVIDYLIRQGKIRTRSSCEGGIQLKNSIFEQMESALYSCFDYECSSNSELKASEKVIAGIFMVDAVAAECHLISWATGNKCVQGSALCTNGCTVNDSHAEVLCRRGLLRFLYQQLEVYLRDEQKSIFRKVMGRLTLRPSLTFHLFISTAPCGDGRIFSFSSEDVASGSAHRPEVDKNKGALRTKIECGEGTVPIPGDVHMQTMDGIFGGERLRTMSCSDKILKWNSLGIQGCLLTAFMRPVYLCTLTIGQLFHYGHLSRSVCCRLGDSLKLPLPFKLNHPYLASCTALSSHRAVSRSPTLAVNWNISDGTVEVLNALTGRVNRTGEVSRLCKRAMYECFEAVESKVRRTSADALTDETYLNKKERCKDYINARDCFLKALESNGYGRWLKKPDEEKMFTLNH